jgi:hypothetical protein
MCSYLSRYPRRSVRACGAPEPTRHAGAKEEIRNRSRRGIEQLGMVLALCGATAVLVWAATGSKLILNDKVASSDVPVINGAAYVKVADVAQAMGMVVVKRADGYEIKKTGGASPIVGVTQGKVGDMLFDSKWRFQVLGMQMVDSYTMKTSAEPSTTLYVVSNWDQTGRVLTPKPN